MVMSEVFFSLDSWQLGLVIFAIIGGTCVVGVLIGRYLRRHSEHYREGIGALQGALLGLVGLISRSQSAATRTVAPTS